MSSVFNRVKVKVSGTPGTGTVTLGIPHNTFQKFSSGGAITNTTVEYVIEEGSKWEVGLGLYTNSGGAEILARTTVLETSNSDNSKPSFSSSATVFSARSAATTIVDTAGNTFESRAAAEAATIDVDTSTIFVISDKYILGYIRDVSGTALTTADGAKWSPSDEPTLSHFNGSTVLLQTYINGLTVKRSGQINGLYDITVPIQSTATRSQTIHGVTDMSNLIQPGSQIRYRNTVGKRVVCTSATAANPAVFTAAAHGLVNNDVVWTAAVSGGTWRAGGADPQLGLAGGPWTVTNATANTFQIANANAVAFNATGYGTLSSATFKDVAEIAALHLVGPYSHSYRGLVLRARETPDAIVKLTANNNLGNSADFSGSITRFDGIHTIPYVDDVGEAGIIIENNKFVTITHSWLNAHANNKPVLRIGTYAPYLPNTYMQGTAGGVVIDQTYIFGDIELTNAYNVDIRATQFDATLTTNPSRIRPALDGFQSPITGCHIQSSFWGNDGGADLVADAALEQPAETYTSTVILPTSGWHIVSNIFRDWPVCVHLKAGWASLKANVFRAHNSSSVAVLIGANAVGDSIDHSNYFLNHLRTGAIGIRDDRYASKVVTGATQANPVVLTAAAHGYANGDRIRTASIGGMTQIENLEFVVQGATTDTFQLWSLTDNGATSAAIDGTGYTAYTSGGTVKRPYMWHRQSIGGTALSLGHGPMVFDLTLDNLAGVTVGTRSLLTMQNVPMTGGRYRVSYGGTVDMASATGLVSFTLLVNGVTVSEANHSFDHQGSANTEVAVNFSKIIPLAAYQSTNGTSVILRVTSPGTINIRGRKSGTLGQFFCQIERVA